MRIRLRLTLGLLLALATLATIPATAAPYPPDLSLRRYLSHTDFIPRAAQGGMSNPPIVFQNQGVPLGVSFTLNCSTGMSCSFISGVMTLTATGGGGFPRLDQVLDPTADKTFAMGTHLLSFADAPTSLSLANGIVNIGSDNGQLYVGEALDVVTMNTVDVAPAEPIYGEMTYSSPAATVGYDLAAVNGSVNVHNPGGFTGTIPGAWGMRSRFLMDGDGPTVQSGGGLDIVLTNTTHTPAIQDLYGLRIGDVVGATTNKSIKTGLGKVELGDNVSAPTYSTATNCSSSASPATCGSAAAGSVAVPTGITPTLVVNTTAVTANSQILFTPDESLGTKLSVTCNSTIAQVAIEPIVTARTAATSFTIQYNTTITTNPICLSYLIIN